MRKAPPVCWMWVVPVIALSSPTPVSAQTPAYDEALAPIGDFVGSRLRVSGAGLRIVERGGVTVDRYWGGYDADTVEPIASATKWLSATVIMTLVDDGLIDLDAPVASYLPAEFAGQPRKGAITVRQMFSHTSGWPGRSSYLGDRSLTLARAVELIARDVPLQAAPGERFSYGGVSMQVAGRVAEVVTGRSWHRLFEERVARPLGLDSTDYFGLGVTANPQIGGGARSSVNDYMKLLAMLASGGMLPDGTRLLSEEAVATMLSDQTGGAELGYAPPALAQYQGYGIGGWIEVRSDDGVPVEFSSPGAFGATPWFNTHDGVYGFFLIRNLNRNVDPLIDDVRAVTRTRVLPEPQDAAAGAGTPEPLRRRWRSGR